ncbi:MAG: uraD [Cellvibrio sp.]|nr:uraD [Cellvibrio sp.]
MTLSEFNALSKEDAIAALYGCCHCQSWAKHVAERRPFVSLEKLLTTANCFWTGVEEEQILEAFSGHARIGDIELLRSHYAGRATQEQGQVLQASEAVIQELHRLNKEYEEKHGFIFIVCASGKSAECVPVESRPKKCCACCGPGSIIHARWNCKMAHASKGKLPVYVSLN